MHKDDTGPWSNRPRAPMTREEFEHFEEQVVEALNPQPLGRTWRVVRRPIWEIDDDETGEVRWTHEYEVREVSPEGYELVLNTCRDLGQALVWAQAHVSQQEEWEVTWTGENTATTRKMIG